MALTKAQLIDLNGNELILDLDADTSITADTDDQIDIKIGGADDFRFTANTFTALSGSTIAAQALTATSITSTGNVVIPNAGTIGSASDADSIAISSAGVVTFSQSPVFPDGSLAVVDLDIDGATDIGAALVDADLLIVDDGAGGTNRKVALSRVKTYIGSSTAADDLTIGDAAVLLTTSAGNITIDAAGNDTDIIFKGTDGSSDRVFMTIDGSEGGDLFLTGGLIDLKNDGSAVSQIKFYCESSNAHAQTLIGAPHSESGTNTLTLPSSGGNSKLLSATSTATVTNKTLTSPVINTGTFGTSILPTSADGTTLGSASKEFSDLFLADASTIQFGADQDVTLTHVADTGLLLSSTDKLMFNDASQFIHAPSVYVLDIAATDEIELTATLIDVVGNFTNSGTIVSAGVVTAAGFTIGSAVIGESELEILDGANVTTTELNLIDGDTSRGTTAVADADGLLINDDGTMRMTTAATVKTYMQSGLTSTSILDADSDTKIQVEESSDEDIIRYDVAGAEVATQTARGFEFTAVGGFMMNQTTNSQTFTIAATENAMVAGPIALSGTITVSGSLAVV